MRRATASRGPQPKEEGNGKTMENGKGKGRSVGKAKGLTCYVRRDWTHRKVNELEEDAPEGEDDEDGCWTGEDDETIPTGVHRHRFMKGGGSASSAMRRSARDALEDFKST